MWPGPGTTPAHRITTSRGEHLVATGDQRGLDRLLVPTTRTDRLSPNSAAGQSADGRAARPQTQRVSVVSRGDRKPRQPRKRTAETVVRTHLAIITGIANEGRTISVHHENELVKASLLYADTVEVLSLGNQMVRELSNFAGGDPGNLWTLLASLDNDTLRHINLDLDPDQLRQAVSILTTMPPDVVRALAEADPATDELNEFAEVLDQTHLQAESSMDELRGVTQQCGCLRRR